MYAAQIFFSNKVSYLCAATLVCEFRAKRPACSNILYFNLFIMILFSNQVISHWCFWGMCFALASTFKILTRLAFCNQLSNSKSNHLINAKGVTAVHAMVHVDKQFLLVLETNMFWQVRWFNAQKSSLSENEPTRVMHHSCVALQTLNEGPSHRIFPQDWLDTSTGYVARSKNIHCNESATHKT